MNNRPKSGPTKSPPAPDAAHAGKARTLANWWGVHPSEAEVSLRYRPKTLQDLTRALVKRLKFKQRQSETEILRVWAESMDPTVAAHAVPAGFRNGTLFVKVDSNVWLHEIVHYRQKEILDRLQSSFGRKKIQKISFRIG